jgi:hypothetical protein
MMDYLFLFHSFKIFRYLLLWRLRFVTSCHILTIYDFSVSHHYICLYPVWADADTWFERQQQEEEMKRLQAEHSAAMKEAEKLHREKVAAEKDGEKEEADPMAAVEAQAVKQSS